MKKVESLKDIINEVLKENPELADLWIENSVKSKKKSDKVYINTLIFEFIKDFNLIDDLKEYIKVALEILYKGND